nr:hypothetical protein [Tanacetum cinerariifolium]
MVVRVCNERKKRRSLCGQGVEWDDSFKEDGVLVGAFGGLGDCGVDIGDGVLAMIEFGGEAIGKYGGDGRKPLLDEMKLKMKRIVNEYEDEL